MANLEILTQSDKLSRLIFWDTRKGIYNLHLSIFKKINISTIDTDTYNTGLIYIESMIENDANSKSSYYENVKVHYIQNYSKWLNKK